MNTNFAVGTAYSFSTITTPLLQDQYNNITLLGEMSFELAVGAGSGSQNLAALAAAIYPSLPSTTSSDPSTYTYLVFKLLNGSKVILAEEWINQNSVVVSAVQTLIATIPNIGSSDQSKISTMLSQAGYSGATFQQISAAPPTLAKIIISGPPSANAASLTAISLTIGNAVSCMAIGLYSDNSVKNISNQVVWASDNQSIAAINVSTGSISPLTVGTSNITANMIGLSSNTIVATVL